MNIGKRIAALRNEKQMTQQALAALLIVTPQAVCRWEKDIVEPDIATLCKIADIFEVSLDFLIRGK